MSDRTAAWNFRGLTAWSRKTGNSAVGDRVSTLAEGSVSHCERNCRTAVFRTIRDIDPAQWDELSGNKAITRSHAYLEAVEASAINDCQYFYPVIFNEVDEIIAHTCVYTITTDFAQLLPRPLQRVAEAIRRFWPRLLQVKITECSSPLAGVHSISVRESEDPEWLIVKLADAVSDIARSQRSSLVVIRDFLQSERSAFDILLGNGYNLASSIPLARIRVRWDTYEEYLANMRSRYRKDVKRRLKRACDGGQQIRILETFGDQADTWVEQARVIYENKDGFKREILTREYYQNMDSKLGERSMLLVVERHGRMVAHGMVLTDDANVIATYYGRDAGPATAEWFSLINELIRIGIERNSSYINLGRGSYDGKSIVGADVEPLHAYSKSTIAPVNWLMKLVPHRMDQPVKKRKRIFHDERQADGAKGLSG